jgi:hypothetical protein
MAIPQSPEPAPASAAQAPADPGWPRTFTKDGTTLVLYQPQVDAWKDHETIKFRCAMEITLAGSSEPAYGVVAVQAHTEVDENNTHVFFSNMKVAAINFPGASDTDAAALKAVALDMLPNKPTLEISLSRVMAYMHDQPKPKGVELNLQPPPIYFRDSPALLVIYLGQPQFKPVQDTSLMWAVNTNWVVLMDTKTSQYYMMVGKSWLTAPDALAGPWTAASQLPAEFFLLPNTEQWKDIEGNVPGQPLKVVPQVITSTEPAELIVTNGSPTYSPIAGTSLMYVSNPEMPVFMDASNSNYYYLVAGRWFSAPSLDGPWAAASANLPAEFAKIPAGSTMGFVLTSVPGTVQANDAVMLAQIPHKSTIKTQGTTVNVTYEGAPKFVTIQGTPMQYAVNTGYQVINANGQYYCCYQGVWFDAPAATGPWVVCTSVPTVIYTIPPSSPVYNVTYVKVYSSTPDTVVVGYTSGYSGSYVAATGALMFGAGMLVGAAIANNNCCWYGYHPCYYSYGCAPYYHYGYSGYYSAGYAHYGPYGGAGWHAGYNPATGNYYRGGAEYGPGGAHYGGQAYNPWTNTYAQHTGGTNGYKSWGNSYVQQGSNWAQAGHESTARGGVGYADNSSGQWAEGAHSNVTNSSVAKTSSGNMYAGHDGNVYKNTGSGWQKYDGDGNWNNVQHPTNSNLSGQTWNPHASGGAQSDWKSNWNSSNLQSSWNNRSSSASGGGWADHDTQSGLNHDSWSRNYGNGGGSGWGGSDHSWGGGNHSWGGGGGRWGGGGGFSGFHGGGRR